MLNIYREWEGEGDFVPFTSEKMGKLKLLYRKKWPEIEKVVKTEQIKQKQANYS